MNLIERVSDILLKPRQTWPAIDAEAASPAGLYKNYIALLAAIPAVAGFIGLSLVGVGGIVNFRVPIVSGLVQMVVGYALSLLMVYVLALIVNALAPKFGGQPSSIGALKLVAYGTTAGFVGGLFSVLPALSALGVLASLYSIYLIYTGLPVLMKCPPERALAYTAVVIVCGALAAIGIGLLTAAVTPGAGRGALAGMGGAGDVTVKLPGTDITINSSQMEQAARKIEQAQASGDTRAAGDAVAGMVGAMLGGGAAAKASLGAGAAIAVDELKGFVPSALAGLPRQSLAAKGDSLGGLDHHEVTASFGTPEKSIEVVLSDSSSLGRLAATAWARSTLDSEDAEQVERIYTRGARAFHETWRKDGSSAQIKLMLDNGVIVELQGQGVGIDGVRQALNDLGLDGLAKVARKP